MWRLWQHLDVYNEAPEDHLEALETQVWKDFGVERTALVLDMSGFSLTVRQRGIVFYMAKVRRMQLLTRPIVEAHGGAVVKFEADNLFAIFPLPAAAVAAALAIQQAARVDLPTDDARHLRLSIGIAHGRLLLLDAVDFFGDCVNVAAKLGEDLAEAGQILIAAETAARCPAELLVGSVPVTYTAGGLPMPAVAITLTR